MIKHIRVYLILLSPFLFFLLFIAGRLGLITHEFIGHGIPCYAFGGEIGEFRLFLFGGGWINYSIQEVIHSKGLFPAIIVQISGVLSEIVIGSALIFLIRFLKVRLVRAIIISLILILFVHASYYFTISMYYGTGDGSPLYFFLNEPTRLLFVALMSMLTVSIAYVLSLKYSPFIRTWVILEKKKDYIIVFCLSALIAGLFHGTLTIGEQYFSRDKHYASLKTPENVVQKEIALANQLDDYRKTFNKDPSPEYINKIEEELDKIYYQFPIEIPLGLAIAAGLVMGFICSTKKSNLPNDSIQFQDNIVLGVLSACFIAAIICVNLFLS